MRSGTLNVPGIVGMGAAATLPADDGVGILRDRLESSLLGGLDAVEVNGHRTERLANTTSLSFSNVDGTQLMKRLPEVAVSSSSACTSALLQPSYVLGAMGLPETRLRGSVRFSLGRGNTAAEIDTATSEVIEAVQSLRASTLAQE
jgi:cysteine desulfurase